MCQEENQRRDDDVVKNLISDNSEEGETWEPRDTSSYTFILLDKERNIVTKAEETAEVLNAFFDLVFKRNTRYPQAWSNPLIW